MRRLCVFCGSKHGVHARYAQAARALADVLAARGVGLVYGGAGRGLMGVLANRMLERGGHVIGVIPQHMQAREIAHPGLSQLDVVAGMHERKARMAFYADAFLALPGGFGTLEELMEVVTWAQLGLHDKPCALLDVGGYFQPLLQLVARMRAEGFVGAAHAQRLLWADSPEAAVDLLSV